jgi:glycogen synthase
VRILVLSNLFPPAVLGGYELECAAAVEHLRESHEVLVLTSREGRGGGPEAGVARVLPFLPHRRVTRLLSPLSSLRAAVATRRAIERFAPEAIWVWNGTMIPQVAIRIAQESGIPCLFRVSEHWFGSLYETDAFMNGLRGGPGAAAMRALDRLPGLGVEPRAPFAAAISWCSESLRRRTPVPDTVTPVLEDVVLPATTQGDRFAALERRPTAEPTILLAGRIAPHKGSEVAVRALAELRRTVPTARLIFAGEGYPDYLAELARLGSELGVTEAIEMRGSLGTAALGELLSGAHAVVVPSVWEEPGGMVVAEGALARVPVVASRIGGIPEYLGDEEALLVPAGDPGALAAALAEALAGGPAVERRVDAAFRRAQRFRLAPYLEALDRFLAAGVAAQR